MVSSIANYRAKSNAKYICQECGSTENIQAHHQMPNDDSSLIVLCAKCHAKKHPDLPLGLFLNKNNQPYWENKSASTIAREVGVHPRTICRRAKRLNIDKGIISEEDEKRIIESIGTMEYKQIEMIDAIEIDDGSYFDYETNMMFLHCNRCDEIVKHWKIGSKPTARYGNRQRYQCVKCGATRYK